MTAFILVDEPLLRSMPLPRPGRDADKDSRGRVLVLAGSEEVPGAIILAAEATLRVGAGKLAVGVPPSIALNVGVSIPECLVIPLTSNMHDKRIAREAAHADAVVLGPGWIRARQAGRRLEGVHAAAPDTPLVIDAAALTSLSEAPAQARRFKRNAVLTPHHGEMAALLNRPLDWIASNAEAAAREAADRFDAVVVLKSDETHIVSPDGPLYLHRSGSVGLATSGSGDVLAGVIGGLLARGATPGQAAVWGVYLHGQAGKHLEKEIGSLGFLGRELLPPLPRLLDRLCR